MQWQHQQLGDDGPLYPGDEFLGKYKIQRLLGRGGFARVYLAYHTLLARHYAIKVIYSPGGLRKDVFHRGKPKLASSSTSSSIRTSWR